VDHQTKEAVAGGPDVATVGRCKSSTLHRRCSRIRVCIDTCTAISIMDKKRNTGQILTLYESSVHPDYKSRARRAVLPALSCSQDLEIFVEFLDVSTALNFARSWVCIVFTRVASQIAALVTSEKAIVYAAEEGVAMAVCAIASVSLRSRVFKGDFFVCFDLGAVEKMLD
jgi:hypothetical protein